MKKAVLMHCWGGYPDYCWYPYVKRAMQERGYDVRIPFVPEPFTSMPYWLKKIESAIPAPDENAVLIGHSLGSVAVMKYLQGLGEKDNVGLVVLVAGFIDDLGYKPIKSFFSEPLAFERIKKKARKFLLISSDDDPYLDLYHTVVLQSNLDAKVIWKTSGHFTENENKIQYRELPELLAEIDDYEKEVTGKQVLSKVGY